MNPNTTPKFGIFWHLKGRIIGRAKVVSGEKAESGSPILDIADSHNDTWDDPEFQRTNRVPPDKEYFEVQRGRVVFNTATDRFTVFSEKRLFTPRIKTKILRFFNLSLENTDFAEDLHYSTNRKVWDQLFKDTVEDL